MAPVLISALEADYILKGIDDNLRADGRGRLDYREVILETGLITQAHGSARCRLGEGTDVLVGVKVDIGTVDIDGTEEEVATVKAKRGRVSRSSPIASQQFAGRGADDINNELTQMMSRVLNGPQGGLNLEKLCIIPGKACWIVYIDALVLDYAGNIVDTMFMTTRAALYNTQVPKAIIHDLGDGEVEFDLSEDVEEWERIEGWEHVPISVTLNKIGSRHIVDATPLEELTTEAKLHVMVNRNGKICGMQKSGSGSIEHSLLSEMVQTGRSLGQNLIVSLDKMLLQEEYDINEKRIRNKPVEKLGFFAAT
ncbi:12221_t:CDS:2 [Dentiscutata erythropus]|uniref:Ribosomal RNA-processing protein 42 n=1 Tax=Dentiscutata erythropus TaxID=1348616 RepID=A0A9N9IWZ9_9GLOM|nr:12221_t:CDS:2 [Dentiscutata erythropus]